MAVPVVTANDVRGALVVPGLEGERVLVELRRV